MRSSRFMTDRLLWTALLALAPFDAGHMLHAQTTVSSVQPAALSVEAGGAGGELIVRGRGLDQVGSVEITLSGRVFSGVSGRVAGASASELVLRIAAAADVRSTSGLRVVLVTPRERIEIAATLDVIVPTPPPPDTTATTPPDTTATPPSPIVQTAGSFIVTVAQFAADEAPPDPLTHTAGVFVVVVVDPMVTAAPPDPVTATAGTFVVTLAPPGSGGQ